MKRWIFLVATLCFLPQLAPPDPAFGDDGGNASRVVAIGDVHGKLDAFVTILEKADLIDGDRRWAGGDTVLVQTGDLTDRGPRVREVLELIMALTSQAELAGGRVEVLLGNHDIGNLVGYLDRKSTPPETYAEIFSDFAVDEGRKARREAYSGWRKWGERYPECTSIKSKAEWRAAHPPGYLAYREAFSPEGRYGRWLRDRRAVTQIGDTLFAHGGLVPDPPPEWSFASLDEINRQIAEEIEGFDRDREQLLAAGIALPTSELGDLYCALGRELAPPPEGESLSPAELEYRAGLQEIRDRLPSAERWLAFHQQGPIWFRGYAKWTEEEGQAAVEKLFARYGVRNLVVGHTPQSRGIQRRFGGRVHLIDTAMVFGAAAGGVPAALELRGEQQTAIYEDRRERLDAPESVGPAATEPRSVFRGPDGEPLPFESDDEVLDYLRGAEVEKIKDIGVGVTKPKKLYLVSGEVRAKAAFRHVSIVEDQKRMTDGTFHMYFRDHYINEVAAYRLSRLLGMDRVPPTVERKIGGQPGSVQLWIEDAMMEKNRREDGVEPPDTLRYNRQRHDMVVFDNLINNIDRNQGNILIDPEWKVWMIDHSRSFARAKELPSADRVVACSRPLYEALRSLEDDQISEALKPYLGGPEIRALLVRRDRLVALIEDRITQNGEDRTLFDYGAPASGIRISD